MDLTANSAPEHAARRVRIGRLWIDAVTFRGAIAAIERLVRARKGGYVFTPNVDHVVTVEEDVRFREAYEGASLSLADGKPVVWAAGLLGTPVPQKISGSDLMEPVLRLAAQNRWRVFLLGAGPGVADAAAEKARREFGVEIAGTSSPMVRLGEGGDLANGVAEVVAARPDVVLVAMGTPKQEIWIGHNWERLAPAVCLGVGASFDFYVGRVRRAPRWVSEAGLEWLYRLVREPRRLAHRYRVKDPRFLLVLARTAREPRSERLRSPASGA